VKEHNRRTESAPTLHFNAIVLSNIDPNQGTVDRPAVDFFVTEGKGCLSISCCDVDTNQCWLPRSNTSCLSCRM